MKLESLSPIQAMSKILCHHGVLFHLLIILQKREREKWEDGIKVEKNRKREKDTRLQNFLRHFLSVISVKLHSNSLEVIITLFRGEN